VALFHVRFPTPAQVYSRGWPPPGSRPFRDPPVIFRYSWPRVRPLIRDVRAPSRTAAFTALPDVIAKLMFQPSPKSSCRIANVSGFVFCPPPFRYALDVAAFVRCVIAAREAVPEAWLSLLQVA